MSKENTEYMENFDLPIYYSSGKCPLKPNIIEDLELVKTKEDTCSSIYSFVFEKENIFANATQYKAGNKCTWIRLYFLKKGIIV